jgi:hypothetical protein
MASNVITPKARQSRNNKSPNFNISDYVKPVVGRVMGIILDENTPTKDLYNKYSKEYGIGTIFYTIYSADGDKAVSNIGNKETNIDEDKINGVSVSPARPFFPNNKLFPLLGELVYLLTFPNPRSVTADDQNFVYYLGPVNIWNNSQTNPLFTNQTIVLGKTFEQRKDIPSLKVFEGDHLIEGRYNSGLRFSNSSPTNKNYWNTSKKSNDSIILLTNGYNKGNSQFYTEDINTDNSSIVLTSSQIIPLNTTVNTSNPITKTILPKKYSDGSQIILNSDRLVFNTKKENILLYSHKDTEIYSNNNISFNANTAVLIKSPKIILGQKDNNTQYPVENAVLGVQLENVLNDILKALTSLGNTLSSVVSTPQGTPLVSVNTAGTTLSNNINNIIKDVEKIKSNTVYLKSNDK